jgi:hypothetical protein
MHPKHTHLGDRVSKGQHAQHAVLVAALVAGRAQRAQARGACAVRGGKDCGGEQEGATRRRGARAVPARLHGGWDNTEAARSGEG